MKTPTPIEKPITGQPLGLSKTFNEMMERDCPVWAWSKKQDELRKRKSF